MAPPSPDIDVGEDISISGSQSKMRKTTSIASTMAEGALLMKEEDAAILERGVRDSCSTGDTPLFAPINYASPTGLSPLASGDVGIAASSTTTPEIFRFKPDERLHALYEQESSVASFRSEHGDEEQVAGNMIPADGTKLTLPQCLSEVNTGSNAEPAKVTFLRCLSGNIVPRSGNLEFCDQRNETCFINLYPAPISEEFLRPTISEVSDIELVEEETTIKSKGMKNSKSYDRRLNEAAQFAEAVGEIPPSKMNETQAIIEEVESDSDEDSNNEIHHNEHSPLEIAKCKVAMDSKHLTKSLASHQSVVEPSKTENPLLDESFTETDEIVANTCRARRPKTRPVWPFKKKCFSSSYAFLHKLPEETNSEDFVYIGISSNPPEITKRGISRGNYAQLHRKAWLEVSDKYHRYGKNLRLYYRYWERLGFPTNQFFDWLDSKGEAAGEPLPNLPECPRSQLDSDTVLYISNPETTQKYSLTVVANEEGRGIVLDVDGDPVKTGPEGWIFVLRDNTVYGAQKITSVTGQSKQRFHHSSFFSGKAVAAAGIFLTDETGALTRLYPHSGHYRPGEADMQRMLFYLHHKKVNLRTFDMDTQQILHVARQETFQKQTDGEQSKEKKKKKVDSLHLQPAVFVACFLAHKARFIREGVFDQIHKIRTSDVTSVSEALIAVDDGV